MYPPDATVVEVEVEVEVVDDAGELPPATVVDVELVDDDSCTPSVTQLPQAERDPYTP